MTARPRRSPYIIEPLMALSFFCLAATALAAPTSADGILFRDDFESYPDTAHCLEQGWKHQGSLNLLLVQDPAASHGGKACLQFGREHSLARKDRSYATVALSSGTISSGKLVWDSWILLGNTTPAHHPQVSSQLTLQALDSRGRVGPSLSFTSKRYNRDRTLLIADGGKIERRPVHFPVDRWIHVSIFLDLDKGRWGFEALPEDGRLLATRRGCAWRNADFAGVDKIRYVCSYANINDGLRDAVDDIVVRRGGPSGASGPDLQTGDPDSENVSVRTEPRHYRRIDPGFYNSSFMSWAGDNLVDRMGLTEPAAMEKRAATLASLGITGVLYNGRHFRLSYQEEWPRIRQYAARVTAVCHAHGIKVIEHHDFTIFAYNSTPLMLDHLDWLQRDVRTGEVHRWACPSNPDFIRWYAAWLAQYQRQTGVDGYMLDEVNFADRTTCGCDACRASFRRALGREMPAWPNPKNSFDSNAYRAMLRWRSGIAPAALGRLMDAVRRVRPDAMSMTYCSDFSDSRIAARGLDLTRSAAMYSSFVGWEVMIAEALNGWRPYLRGLKLRLSYGNYYDIPVWSLNREMTTPDAVYFAWALCQLGKHSIWYGTRGVNTPKEQESLRRFNTWSHRMPHQYARCLTDTGLLLSVQTRFADADRKFFWHDFAGWTDMLLKNNLQFDTLLDGDLEDPGRLGKYQALLLIGQACLTREQCDHLLQWVAAGGNLVWTGKTSLYNGAADRLRDFRLAAATGVHYVGSRAGPFHITGTLNGLDVDVQARHAFAEVALSDSRHSRVLALARAKGSPDLPALVETRWGKGKMLYIAADLGSQQVELEMRNGSTYRCREDPAIETLIRTALRWAHPRPSPGNIEAPQGVVATLYQQQGGPEAGVIYAHLLNATGKHIQPGYRAAYGRPESIVTPAIKAPIFLHLHARVLGPAELRSPERDGSVRIEGKPDGRGGTTFRLPGKQLATYLQVRIPAAPVPGQTPCPVPLAAKQATNPDP